MTLKDFIIENTTLDKYNIDEISEENLIAMKECLDGGERIEFAQTLHFQSMQIYDESDDGAESFFFSGNDRPAIEDIETDWSDWQCG